MLQYFETHHFNLTLLERRNFAFIKSKVAAYFTLCSVILCPLRFSFPHLSLPLALSFLSLPLSLQDLSPSLSSLSKFPSPSSLSLSVSVYLSFFFSILQRKTSHLTYFKGFLSITFSCRMSNQIVYRTRSWENFFFTFQNYLKESLFSYLKEYFVRD